MPVSVGAETAFLTGGAGSLTVIEATDGFSAVAGVSSKGLSETTVIFFIGIGSSSISKLFFFRHSVDTTE